MALGLVGRKIGMTRLFAANGEGTPVTVLEVTANRVTQVKDEANDGYRAVQLTIGKRRADKMPKALAGKFAKAGVEPRSSWTSSRWAATWTCRARPLVKALPARSSATISAAVAPPTVIR
jgi:large subunit ribosomal protein L3